MEYCIGEINVIKIGMPIQLTFIKVFPNLFGHQNKLLLSIIILYFLFSFTCPVYKNIFEITFRLLVYQEKTYIHTYILAYI